MFLSVVSRSHPDGRRGSEEEGHDHEEEGGGGGPRGHEATSERGAGPNYFLPGGGSPQDLRCLLCWLLPLQGQYKVCTSSSETKNTLHQEHGWRWSWGHAAVRESSLKHATRPQFGFFSCRLRNEMESFCFLLANVSSLPRWKSWSLNPKKAPVFLFIW